MDGVLVHGKNMIPGADDFINRLIEEKRKFLILTNNPLYTTRDLAHRLQVTGLNIPEEKLYTSALATAAFLDNQRPKGTAYVIGELGLSEAIHAIGYTQTAVNPDYVVLGETFAYSIEQITVAVRLITAGARFIATNPDPGGNSEQGLVPACGAMAALIERATNIAPFYDALCAQLSGCALRKLHHGWRPHGHGRPQRHLQRHGYCTRSQRNH
jgi:NagD protein